MNSNIDISDNSVFPFGENADRQKWLNLKVCGMTHHDNILDVAALQPDYLGFIFYEKSVRYFDATIPKLPDNIKKIGVFVNATMETILEKINRHQLNGIQLHGNESPQFCKVLSCHFEQSEKPLGSAQAKSQKTEIIKVFSIDEHFDFDTLKPYETVCDYFLFDTKGKLPGGNGYVFNWDILHRYPSTKPYFLSGGIGLDTMDALNDFLKHPASKFCHAIDVNSKFEIEAGLKDVEKLKPFFKEFRT